MARRRDSHGRFVKRHHTAKYRTTRVIRRTTHRYRRHSGSHSARAGKTHTKPLLLVLGAAAAFFIWQKMRGGPDAVTAAANAQMAADAAAFSATKA